MLLVRNPKQNSRQLPKEMKMKCPQVTCIFLQCRYHDPV